jgi:hypothetical protein
MNDINQSDLAADIQILEQELARFEEKYGLSSDAFYDWYVNGNEPEDESLIMETAEWAGIYKSRQRLLALRLD